MKNYVDKIKIMSLNPPEITLSFLNDSIFLKKLDYNEIANPDELLHEDKTLLDLYQVYTHIYNNVEKLPYEKSKLVFKIYKNYIYSTMYREYRRTPLKLKDNTGFDCVFTQDLPSIDLSKYDEKYISDYNILNLINDVVSIVQNPVDKYLVYKLNFTYNLPIIKEDLDYSFDSPLINESLIVDLPSIPNIIDTSTLNFDYISKLNYSKYRNPDLIKLLNSFKINNKSAVSYYSFAHLLLSELKL